MLNGWPYAAKAVIQHEFDTDHLNIWVTFDKAMRLSSDPLAEPPVYDRKPPDEKWIVYVDEVLKEVTVSAWQDDWTLLLTVPDIGSLPDRVLVAYDGPDEMLEISWHKQWEPWGAILSLDVTT